MKTELFYLALVAALTGVLWMPYVLDRFGVWGLLPTVSYPQDPPPLHPWAQRLMRAHANAIENLAVFATLVLVANAAGVSNAAIATASMVYFFARVVHALAYVFAIPWVRTVAFLVGFAAQATVAWHILVH